MNLNFSFRRSLSLSLFFAQSLIVEAQEIPILNSGLWLKIQSATATARDFILDNIPVPPAFMGSNPLKPEVDAEIRSILREIGYSNADSIRLRRLSLYGIFSGLGNKNALAWGFIGLPKYIFVDEDWFETLSTDQKRFIISHEVAHLRYFDVERKILIIGLISYFCVSSATKLRAPDKNGLLPEDISVLFLANLLDGPLKNYAILPLVGLYISRLFEYQADKRAVSDLRKIEGGLEFFQEREQFEAQIDSELPQWKINKWLRWFVREYFTTHPPCKDRIAYLKKIEKSWTKT